MWQEDNKKLADDYRLNSETQTVEECAELIQALCKKKRLYNDDKSLKQGYTAEGVDEAIIEEIADVVVCLDRLIYLYACKDEVNAIAEQKIKRTFERIEKTSML